MATKQVALTPTRRDLLRARIRCLQNAERRVKRNWSNGKYAGRRFEPFALALAALKSMRSIYTAELEGKPWQATLFKPR